MAKDPNPFFIELKSVGWIPLYDSERVNGQIPKQSGVYCFIHFDQCEERSEVVYVGKSVNLSVRLKPWHSIERNHNDSGYLFCYIILTDDQDNFEKVLIRKYRPKYNVHHNPAIRRVITYV